MSATDYTPQAGGVAAIVVDWLAEHPRVEELTIADVVRIAPKVRNSSGVHPFLNTPVLNHVLERGRNDNGDLVFRRGRHFAGAVQRMKLGAITPATAEQRAAASAPAPAAAAPIATAPGAQVQPNQSGLQSVAPAAAPSASTHPADRSIAAPGVDTSSAGKPTAQRAAPNASLPSLRSHLQQLEREIEQERTKASAPAAAPTATPEPQQMQPQPAITPSRRTLPRGAKELPPLDLSAIDVREGVPPPTGVIEQGRSKYDALFGKLSKPGQSFTVDIAYIGSLQDPARKYSKKHGRKIIVRRERCGKLCGVYWVKP